MQETIWNADSLMAFGNSDSAKQAERLYKLVYDTVTIWIVFGAYRKHLNPARVKTIESMILHLEDILGIETDEDRKAIWDEYDPLRYMPEIRKDDLRLGKIASIMDSLMADNLR
jgi:hypothetical protein